jgi:hypothetical protein
VEQTQGTELPQVRPSQVSCLLPAVASGPLITLEGIPDAGNDSGPESGTNREIRREIPDSQLVTAA